jgi:putative transposase
MIRREHELSVTRQAKLLRLSRASVYYTPLPVPETELALMRRLDELHLELPLAGSRMLRDLLNAEGVAIGREHVRTLMRRMGITAVYQRPKTTRRHRAHPVFPYLLRTLTVTRPNHVWAADITYLPMARGFVYLVVVMDWASRKVLTWRVSPTLTSDFCVAALEEALARFGTPEIFNTDQGSQFTSAEFLNVLRRRQIAIRMDGTGCWRDNVFVERLWRSVKNEEVYLRAYETVSDARAGLTR